MTSPTFTEWLGLSTRNLLTRILPEATKVAANVRDFTSRMNQSHLSSR
jgi:hypothetical protein